MKILTIIFFFSSFLFSYELPVKLYKNSDGLPQEQVRAIVQNKDGEIVLGTLGGVGIYDGKSFKRLGLKDGLPTDEIQCLDIDEKGILWIGTPLGLASFDGYEAKKVHFKENINVDFLKIQTRGEEIYFLTREGLYLWDKYNLKFIDYADSFCLSKGELIFSKDNKIFTYTKDNLSSKEIPIKAKIQVMKKSEGIIYLGTERGFYLLDEKDGLKEMLKGYSIVDILKDSYGNIWLATSQEGIFLYNNGLWYHYYSFEGLPFDIIYCIFEDREKNIWFGSISGLAKVSFRQIFIFSKAEGLENLYVNAIYQRKNGEIWIGYRGGISKFLPDKLNFERYKGEELSKLIIRSISEDLDGNLLLGTHDNGLYIERNKKFYPILCKDKKIERVYYMLYIPYKGTYIASKEGLFFWDTKELKYFGKKEGLDVEVIYHISSSPEGILYLGTQKGVYAYDGKRFFIPENMKDLKCEVNVVYFSKDGDIWVGSHGLGLYHFTFDSLEIFNEENGFPNDFLWGITEDLKGSLWCATNKGIHKYQDGNWITLNSRNGLPGDEIFIHTAFKDIDGNLWFGLPKGLVFLTSNESFQNKEMPIIKIRKIQTPKRTISKIEEKIFFKANERRIYFDFVGISLQDETEVMYQLFLKGYDEEWNVPTKESYVNYTNLKPGNYEFWIKARNNSGLWTEPKKMVSFEINFYFYEKFMFKFGAFLLGLLFIISIFYYRLNAINKAKIKLEEMVKERTEELQRKIQLIEALSNMDPLTEIYNRRFFIKQFENTLQLGKRHGEHFCFVLIDLDNFKEINERYGHLIGDKVLIEFSKILKSNFRETDVPARYGGDEFVLLLPKADPEGVKNRLDSLLEELQYQPFEIDGISIFLSFSAGVVGVYPKPDSSFTFDDVSAFTDNFLFRAKRSGKGIIIMENFQV